MKLEKLPCQTEEMYQLWKKDEEEKMEYLKNQKGVSRDEAAAQIRAAQEEYAQRTQNSQTLTDKDKKILLNRGQKKSN